jgi:hypothetical protein
MKKFFYTLVFSVVTMFAVAACTEETIQPVDGSADDKCQFGGTGCPKS